MDLASLTAEFPRDAVSWRAQTMTADGTKALALAYIDARDVMDRLDSVCGPANWRDSYVETAKGRIICTLEIRIDGEWIAKSDGAGDTDVEGDKGAISDALKRAAVKWGIGRYLYSLPSVWAPCEHFEKGGKKYWKAWRGDPWDSVRAPRPQPVAPAAKPEAPQITPAQWCEQKAGEFSGAGSAVALDDWWRRTARTREKAQAEAPEAYRRMEAAFRTARATLAKADLEPNDHDLAGVA